MNRHNPYVGWLFWCHNCWTYQMGEQLRWLPMGWTPVPASTWGCCNCDEPAVQGVWPKICPEHLTDAARSFVGKEFYANEPGPTDECSATHGCEAANLLEQVWEPADVWAD